MSAVNGGHGAGPSTGGAAPVFPKRFYKQATTQPLEGGGHALMLDGRPARTPGRAPFVLPTKALADAIAAEWQDVPDVIDPRRMPLTRLANTVIDGVSAAPEAVLDEVIRFAGSDLVVYRAADPADLVRAQAAAWDPITDWSRTTLGAPLKLGEGVMFVAQPAASLDAIAAELRAVAGAEADAPFRIAALHVITTLTGSAMLALALARGIIDPDAAWTAAHVDEDHQIALWGEDHEAAERRTSRRAEYDAAVKAYRLATG